ncbi:MAG TPA: ABC transporter permease [Clostridiales bacterium]|nr:ABC transporter permease [Clostridiales bacterium]
MRYLSLYLEFYKIKLKGIVEYRSSFFLTSISKFVNYLAHFITIWIMINAFETMGSWNAYEIMMLFSLQTASYAIAGSFTYHITTYLSNWIKDGTFDEVLTKPLNPFLYLASRLFSWGYFGTMTIALVVMIYCFVKLNITLSFIKVLFIIPVIIGGGLITGAMMIFASIPAFWIVENNFVANLIFTVKDITDYPITIFSKGLQILVTLIIPYAFVNFFPAQFFLDKNDFSIFHPAFQFLTPVIGVIMFYLAYKLWMFGISHYKSTGS